ncbi:MAG: ATP-dependent DNA ligase [Candidatus Nanoarchaeia archaeon]|nr:ATP-dependent DNA ligase [Candidatus Nanoarchaeia archaeon]MDD5239686.1 ATP-dependent DNA ligase [Candidatus Nanoarchaeia archaeon]
MKFRAVAEYFEKLEATSKRLEMFKILSELFQNTPEDDIDKLVYLIEERIRPAFEGVEIGMAEKMLEKAIAKATGTELSKVTALYKKKGDQGLAAEELAKKVTAKLVKPKELTLAETYEGFYKTAKISGSGAVDQKVGIIAGLLSRASPIEAKYIARFVIGRLRLGIGDPTIMDSLAQAKEGNRELRPELERAYNLCSDLGLVAKTYFTKGLAAIKKFSVTPGKPIRMALAERLPTAKEIIEKIGKCSVEAKYDGFRIQAHKIGDKVSLFSRNLENMTSMLPDVAESIKKYVRAKDAILEGEALVYNEDTGELMPFQITITRKRKYDIASKKVELPLKMFVFDLLYADGKDYTSEPYSERIRAIEKYVKTGEALEYANRIITDDPKVMQKFFDESVTAGLEGVMAKRLDAPYSAGARNFNWIKLKRSYRAELSDTVDVVIIGYIKGRGMRTKFGIGAVLGAVYNDKKDVFESICKIGTGFSEENWVKIRKLLDEIKVSHQPARVDSELKPDVWVEPKYVLEITADEITLSPMHTAGKTNKDDSGYALRFPRVKGFIREDKKPEDATTVKEIEKMFKQQKNVGSASSES